MNTTPGAGILSGKKTYVTAAIGVIGSVAAYFTGEASFMQVFQTVTTCLSAAFLRNGVAKLE